MKAISGRLERQIQFLIEIDKTMQVFRKTKLFDKSRFENAAEHAWHLGLMAMVLGEYANEKIDLAKVIKMVLIHDIVEIDAGDTIVYDTKSRTEAQERKAWQRKGFLASCLRTRKRPSLRCGRNSKKEKARRLNLPPLLTGLNQFCKID